MKLYIETENGQPKNHPALEENLLQAFGSIPENWIPFVRVERPELNPYIVVEQDYPNYQLIDGVYKDVWAVRPMTEEEKLDKQNNAITAWNNRYPSWLFNEETCAFDPPVPYPQDGKYYQWEESIINWVEVINE